MIFLNNKVKSLLFALVVFTIVISLSCVGASDDFNQTNDIIGDENTGDVITASGEIFISPDGTGSGESADSPTDWDEAYSLAKDGDTIVFLGGNYTWDMMQTFSKSLILKGYGDDEAIIDAHDSTGFFRTTTGTTIQLINLTFFNAQTGDTDRGSIVNNGKLIIINSYFAKNKGWGTEGGAIHNYGSCDVYNSTFVSNTGKKGGSFYGDKHSVLNVYNSIFISGSSKGGNCFNIKEATANIYNCQFYKCSAKTGIVYTKKGTVNIFNSNFSDSSVVDYAACVDVDKESSVYIENCNFDNCTSTGGVIWNTDGKKIGTGNGGAVYVEKGGSLTIKNSKFTNCGAKSNGGALYIESKGNALIQNCTFISNNAAQGRHIYIEGSVPTVSDCTFEVNDTLNAENLSSGGVVVNIHVDVGTNFMQYDIPVMMSENEVGEVNKVNSAINLNNLADGQYNLSLNGNDKLSTNKYIFTQEYVLFNVGNTSFDDNGSGDEIKYDLKAPEVELYYKNGTRFYAYLFDSNSNPVANENVTISINGQEYVRTTDANGSVSLAINLNVGVYDVEVSSKNISANSKITVLSTISGKDVTKIFSNGTQYYATFTDGQGNPLANGTEVEFNINGVMYKRLTNENGTARLNINLRQGNYIITATNPVNGEMASNTITVLPKIVENSDLVKYYRNDSQYVVRVLGDDGNPVGENETVTFNINGVMYERKTNASGYAQLNINLRPGDYIITAMYGGCSVANNITVKPILSAENITMKYRDGTQFNATLLDGEGNLYVGQNVIFNINGVFYNRTTDSAGIAHLNINLQAGEYIITSMYNGAVIANKITINSV
ncbi:MAG: hypothetical protein IJQ68_09690 [Methanobrevibacter sp.]|uniref:right-handed parallel beta-helix repeat-containing protein n=1 Tax=Methanobrevibacter sp. TaxID=66852 RepID=UPI0025F20A85|nr:hypothetical protein [Methanobrevibacter sp.]MBR0272238.1 hypothetical protein [Methanobrevibacter sp.]